MIDHVSLYTSDYDKAKAFYLAALKPLGYELIKEFPEYGVAGMGAQGKPDFWLTKNDKSAKAHVAFMAMGKEQADAFYKAALATGGKDNGAPGYRKDYSPGYYAAYALDPDGNNIEVVWHDPGAA